MIIQAIVNTAEICARHGVEQAVICPGSRSAPITLAFARHPDIKTFVIPDERSAGFFAMGLAQSSDQPVVIICTSGTAVANLYPAIIESFYQQVPLLVLTADRPPEWIDQQDGQTIRQQNIFKNHILASYQFPVESDHPDARWQAEKMVSEAILKASETGLTSGPVHINIPIREPFYPDGDEKFQYSSNVKVIRAIKSSPVLEQPQISFMMNELEGYDRIMVLAGQSRTSEKLKQSLDRIQEKYSWVVVGDIVANIQDVGHAVTHIDVVLKGNTETPSIKPDLLITFGQGVLSKALKNFLRKNPPKDHWSVGINSDIDTFKSLTKSINASPEYFFDLIEDQYSGSKKSQTDFFELWADRERTAKTYTEQYFKTNTKSEFQAVHTILNHLPQSCQLHLANSMPVRYANLIGFSKMTGGTVWSNRGTSGIDGCISTGLGHAVNSDQINLIMAGDMAFFYDRNGLWHNHIPNNLRIVILNNHGGGIFRLIDGPRQLEELQEYFETKQNLNAVNTAKDFGMTYYHVEDLHTLPDVLKQFFDSTSGASILEIETEGKQNQKSFEEFMHKAGQI